MWQFNDGSSDVQRKWQPDAPRCHENRKRGNWFATMQEWVSWKVVKKGLGITRRTRYALQVIQDSVTNMFKITFFKAIRTVKNLVHPQISSFVQLNQ